MPSVQSFLLASCLSVGVCSSAFSQSSSSLTPFDGDWSLQMKNGSGTVFAPDLSVTIKGTSGTYQNQRAARENLCGRLLVPLQEVKQEEGKLEFLVVRSTMLKGCEDFRVRLATQDGKLSGTSSAVTSDGERQVATVIATKR